MNENEICREIAYLHDHIYAAGIIDKQQLRARYSKVPENWDPNDERIKSMLAQPKVLLGISKTNEFFFGALKYISLMQLEKHLSNRIILQQLDT